MARIIPIISTTKILVTTKNETLVQGLRDYLVGLNQYFNVDYEADLNDEWWITVRENGNAKYYPSNDWYEPDDYETNFCTEDDFYAYARQYVADNDLDEDMFEVNYVMESEWEEV